MNTVLQRGRAVSEWADRHGVGIADGAEGATMVERGDTIAALVCDAGLLDWRHESGDLRMARIASLFGIIDDWIEVNHGAGWGRDTAVYAALDAEQRKVLDMVHLIALDRAQDQANASRKHMAQKFGLNDNDPE